MARFLSSLFAGALALLLLVAGPAQADQRALIGSLGHAGISTPGATWYIPFGGSTFTSSYFSTTETPAAVKMRGAGTITEIYEDPAANARTTNTTLCLRKNGANAQPDGGGADICKTWGNIAHEAWSPGVTVSFVDGDTFAWSLTTDTGAQTFTLTPLTAQLTTPGTTQVFTHIAATGSDANSAAKFYGPGGNFGSISSEASVFLKMLETATLSNMAVGVSANTDGTNRTFVSKKNGVTGGQSVTVTANTPGFYDETDVGAVDDVVLNDTWSISRPATSGGLTQQTVGVKYQSATPGRSMIVSFIGAASITNAQTPYFGLWRGPIVSSSTQANTLARLPFALDLSHLTFLVTSYSGTTDIHIEVYKNTSTLIHTMVIPHNGGANIGSAFFTDTTPISFAQYDTLSFRITNHNATVGLGAMQALVTDVNATAPGAVARAGRCLTMGVC